MDSTVNYAIVENGIVVNIVVGLPDEDIGIATGDSPVVIGDQYVDGTFIRGNVAVVSDAQRIEDLLLRIAELEARLQQ